MSALSVMSLVPLGAMFVPLALAACGSGGSTGTTGGAASPFAVARCMRSHGVPDFPDPAAGPGGAGISISAVPGSSTLTVNGTAFSGPAFESAARTCKLFGGREGPPPISEQQRLRMLAFARCMRGHGVPNFPDPPLGAAAAHVKAPDINVNAPDFQQAVRTCRKP
jgi:hypothetical protein